MCEAAESRQRFVKREEVWFVMTEQLPSHKAGHFSEYQALCADNNQCPNTEQIRNIHYNCCIMLKTSGTSSIMTT